MTEQYRNGSDDDDFFLPRQHTAMKRISFLIPLSHHHFQYYYSSLKKKKIFISISSQSNPVQFNSQPKISSSRSKKKKEEQRKTSPLPFGRTYLTYLAPILSPPFPPFTEIRLSLSLSKPLQVPMSSEVVDV